MKGFDMFWWLHLFGLLFFPIMLAVSIPLHVFFIMKG